MSNNNYQYQFEPNQNGYIWITTDTTLTTNDSTGSYQTYTTSTTSNQLPFTFENYNQYLNYYNQITQPLQPLQPPSDFSGWILDNGNLKWDFKYTNTNDIKKDIEVEEEILCEYLIQTKENKFKEEIRKEMSNAINALEP